MAPYMSLLSRGSASAARPSSYRVMRYVSTPCGGDIGQTGAVSRSVAYTGCGSARNSRLHAAAAAAASSRDSAPDSSDAKACVMTVPG